MAPPAPQISGYAAIKLAAGRPCQRRQVPASSATTRLKGAPMPATEPLPVLRLFGDALGDVLGHLGGLARIAWPYYALAAVCLIGGGALMMRLILGWVVRPAARPPPPAPPRGAARAGPAPPKGPAP